MTPLSRIAHAAQRLKVFPLPSAVLLPGAALPLHIFEPRYQALLEDCLAKDRVMALADLQPGWEGNDEGRPPLRPVACAGMVILSEPAEGGGGRQNILLQGVVRVRVLEEWENDQPYREVRAEVCEDAPYAGPLEELLRQAVLEIAGRLEGEVASQLVQLAARTEGGQLADVVSAALVQDLQARHAILAELDVSRRLERVVDAVEDLMARMGAVAPRGPLN